MFSILLFLFVGVVLVIGLVGLIWRKRNRVPLEGDESTERVRRTGAFKETSTKDIKGGIIPADNKLSQPDFSDQKEEQ